MAKPRPCPECENGVIKKNDALRCWNCYVTKLMPQRKDTWLSRQKGNKHPNWTGGSWLYWRKQTLIRDNYTCQHCGLYDKEIMDVDHIEPIRMTVKARRDFEKELQAKLSGTKNLQTLCPNCHKRKSIQEAKSHSVHLKSR